jgi:leucyl aminopeptidase
MQIQFSPNVSNKDNLILLANESSIEKAADYLLADQFVFLQKKIAQEQHSHCFYIAGRLVFIQFIKTNENIYAQQEECRVAGASLGKLINSNKVSTVHLQDLTETGYGAYFAEGLALSNYQFLKYKSAAAKQKNSLTTLYLTTPETAATAALLQYLTQAVYHTRDLVNEPLSYLTAPQLANSIEELASEAGFEVEVMDKAQIEALGMGGLLAVNKGSLTPPTFSILKWQPKESVNTQPIVLVGKGVVYDTGGLSLKPTANSMDFMKADMAGAAAVVGAIYACAKAELPVQVIGLIPATDNRPGQDAYAPGDVITMYSGKTVEVLNTDAEGRLLLADALQYAKQYQPSLVLDLATLTGSAVGALGTYAAVFMGNADEASKAQLQSSAKQVHERLVEFPMWDDYGKLLESSVADIKNIGGPLAGAITAGKFLEHFTDYPWLHLDIAGPSYLHSGRNYITQGGSGYGTRLLFDFLCNYAERQKNSTNQ